MPIEIITGQPGNGKTALMVQRLLQEAKKAQRPLYAAGIDGLEDGLATRLDDPKAWNAVRPGEVCICNKGMGECHAHEIPNGALIFVDEAWKWFGHLHDATRQATPKHVLDLAEHRHRGLDFVWTTQMPNQIYPFVRGLIANHTHVLRRFGTQIIETFTWAELNEEVKSTAKRDNALRKTTTLPREAFGKYKSASEHTIKARVPLRVILIPFLFLLGAALFYAGYRMVMPKDPAASGPLAGPDAAQAAPAPTSDQPTPERGRISHASAGSYAVALTPQVQEAPWTARAFEGRAVRAEPEVYCMSSEAGDAADGYKGESVTCITEQGTLYKMDTVRARKLARNGPVYNPYKQQPKERNERGRGAGGTPAAMPRRGASAPVGIGDAEEPWTDYGGFREG